MAAAERKMILIMIMMTSSIMMMMMMTRTVNNHDDDRGCGRSSRCVGATERGNSGRARPGRRVNVDEWAVVATAAAVAIVLCRPSVVTRRG